MAEKHENNLKNGNNTKHIDTNTSIGDERTSLEKWAQNQPKWQQDALRRLAQSSNATELSNNDIEELTKILFAEAKGEDLDFEPLQKKHLPGAVDDEPATCLTSLGPVANIDRLASKQPPLEFLTPNGLTVIFGVNGSGKSGFARILKNLCRAQGKINPIRGDARQKDPAPWKVTYSYAEGETPSITKNWGPKKALSEELKRIVIFDSHTANTYVDEHRTLIFLPLELRLLKELASVAETIKNDIADEEENLKEKLMPLPHTSSETKVGSLAKQLEGNEACLPTEQDINDVACWNKDEETRLEALRQFEAVSPGNKKQILKTAIGVFEQLKAASQLLDDSNMENLKTLLARQKSAQQAVEESARSIASGMPLSKSVESETWRTMFEAARKFAQERFPETEAPQIATADICVLCQQELDEETRGRLQQFDQFIEGELQKNLQAARQNYQNSKLEISELQIEAHASIGDPLQAYRQIGEQQATQVTNLVECLEKLNQRFTAIKALLKRDDYTSINDLPKIPFLSISQIKTWITDIQRGQSSMNEEAQKVFAELKDKKTLNENLDVFKRNLAIFEELKILTTCKNMCHTKSITAQTKRRYNEVLSRSIEERYLKEICELDLDYLNISLSEKAQKGEQQIAANITDLKRVRNLSDILSEGEQRAVALVGFLTEINETDAGHAAIFDDPISSLDWDRKKLIAGRLVKEAQKRQIIVFSHDYSFVLMLKKHSENKNSGSCEKFKYQWVAKKSLGTENQFGVTGPEAEAWEYKNVRQRINDIEQSIKELKKRGLISDQTGRSEFEKQASDIVKQLRQTWERAVEEIALNRTMERMSEEVRTQNMKKISYNAEAHYQKLHEGMSFVSGPLHDSSKESGTTLTTYSLQENLELLKKWVTEIKPVS